MASNILSTSTVLVTAIKVISSLLLLALLADSFILNSNLLYVGVTRAKKTCYHVGNAYAVNRAIQKKEDWSRNTFLYKILSE